MASDVVKFVLQMQDNASAPLKGAGKAATQAGKDAKGASTKWTEMASKLALAGAAAKAAKAGFSAIAGSMLKMGTEAVGAGAQMEGFQTRLTVLMGNASDAKARLDELFLIGSTTPFELPGLIEAEVNLRALGVNAQKTLPMVMDFAGAMGVDLASAAVEVGRAMQFGAGAVETISGRALRAQVELRTGADALKMSTSEFRQAMVETLTDPDGIFAGGTQKLAATFDGMVSNLKDSWFKFTKDVADAGLFDVAKETLREVLRLIGDNSDGFKTMATVVSEGLSKSLLGTIELMGVLFDSVLATGSAFLDIARGWTNMVRSLGSIMATVGLGPSDEEMAAINARINRLDATKDALQDMGGMATRAGDLVARVEANVLKAQGLKVTATAGGAPVQADAAGRAEAGKEDPEAKKARELLTGQLTELNDISMISAAWLEEMTSIQRQSSAELPVKMASASVGMLADPISSLTGMLGPAGGLIEGIASLGQMGAEKITEMLGGFIDAFIIGLVEVIPDLLVAIPEMLIEKLPEILGGILEAIPKILQAVLIKLPVAIARGAWVALKRIWAAVKKFFSDLWDSITPWQTGGVVQQTGLAYLHQGERIIPTSGASTQAVMAGASNIGAGQAINISTNVVDPNAIDGLARMLQRELGSFGGGRSLDIFNTPSAAVG